MFSNTKKHRIVSHLKKIELFLGYNLYFNTIQSIQLKHNIHWEFTILNLGPQEPLWAQTQLFRPGGTQSCYSPRTWAPAHLHFPALTHILGPILGCLGYYLLSSLFLASVPVAQSHLEKVSAILTTHHIPSSPSLRINYRTQGNAGFPL